MIANSNSVGSNYAMRVPYGQSLGNYGDENILPKESLSHLALMLTTAIATYVLMANVWTKTNLITEKIASGEIQPELSVLMDLLSEQSSTAGSSSMTMATIVQSHKI